MRARVRLSVLSVGVLAVSIGLLPQAEAFDKTSTTRGPVKSSVKSFVAGLGKISRHTRSFVPRAAFAAAVSLGALTLPASAEIPRGVVEAPKVDAAGLQYLTKMLGPGYEISTHGGRTRITIPDSRNIGGTADQLTGIGGKQPTRTYKNGVSLSEFQGKLSTLRAYLDAQGLKLEQGSSPHTFNITFKGEPVAAIRYDSVGGVVGSVTVQNTQTAARAGAPDVIPGISRVIFDTPPRLNPGETQ